MTSREVGKKNVREADVALSIRTVTDGNVREQGLKDVVPIETRGPYFGALVGAIWKGRKERAPGDREHVQAT